jgi:hypothetical protein
VKVPTKPQLERAQGGEQHQLSSLLNLLEAFMEEHSFGATDDDAMWYAKYFSKATPTDIRHFNSLLIPFTAKSAPP